MAFPSFSGRRLGDHLMYMGERARRIHEEDAIARAREVVPVEQLWQRAREEMESYNSLVWFVGESAGEATPGEESAGEATLGEESAGEATPGEESAGEATPGEESAGEATPGEESAGEATPGEESAGEATPGEESAGEATLGEESAGEATLGGGTPSASGPRKALSSPCATFFVEALTRVLLAWFRDEFFSKQNKSTCPLCECQDREVGCDLRHPPWLFSAGGALPETDVEIRGQARYVEIFTCERCHEDVRFPCLSDPVVLLETRTGGENEWILAFMLCCVAAGLDVREVSNLDVVYWAEVWWPEPAGEGAREADEALPSPARGRWAHVDPFTGEVDAPGRSRRIRPTIGDVYVAVGWGSCGSVMPRYSLHCRSAAHTVRETLRVARWLELPWKLHRDEDEDSLHSEEQDLPASSKAEDGADGAIELYVEPPDAAERFWDERYRAELRQFGDLQRLAMSRALTDAAAKAAQGDQRVPLPALPRELTALPTSPEERVAFEEARERNEAAQMAMRVYGGFSCRLRGDLRVRLLDGDEGAVLDGAQGARWPRIALTHVRPSMRFQRVPMTPPTAASSSSPPPFPGAALLRGGVCRASDDNPPRETASAAFDGSPSTKWLCFDGQEGGAWLERRVERRGPRARPPARLVGIALTSADDFPECDPAAVEVQAMDANGRWVCVAEFSDLAFSERHETIARELPSPSLASWAFRLVVCRVQDSYPANCVQLEAWDLYVADA